MRKLKINSRDLAKLEVLSKDLESTFKQVGIKDNEVLVDLDKDNKLAVIEDVFESVNTEVSKRNKVPFWSIILLLVMTLLDAFNILMLPADFDAENIMEFDWTNLPLIAVELVALYYLSGKKGVGGWIQRLLARFIKRKVK